MPLVEKTKKRWKVRLVKDLLLRIEVANFGMVLVQGGAGHLPDTDGLEAVKAGHRIIPLDPLSLWRSLRRRDVEVRLETLDSHACDRLVAQASEDVDNILAADIMFVPIRRLHLSCICPCFLLSVFYETFWV